MLEKPRGGNDDLFASVVEGIGKLGARAEQFRVDKIIRAATSELLEKYSKKLAVQAALVELRDKIIEGLYKTAEKK